MVLEINGAEADDIIATLAKYFSTNELTTVGLVEEPDIITIGSTDKDFQQLQKYKNVQQWNNVMKKLVKCKNPKEFLIEHIISGDTGDNVPNVCTGDDWAKCRAENIPTRANSLMTTRIKDFHQKEIEACINETERRNYKRNELLVNLDLIPSHISDTILKTYKDYEIKGSKGKVFKYLNEHRMKLLLSSYNEF
jgi:hypothetical protein